MRVLVVTNMYPSASLPSFGTFVHDQVEALRETGVEVDVLAFNGRESKWRYLWAFPRYWLTLLRGNYDLVHAHYILAGVVARAQWGRPVVLTHHGPEVLGQPRWQGPLCKLMTPLFDQVIHVTEQVRRKLHDDDGWVIPCGVDLDTFNPIPRDRARSELGFPADKRLVLFAGDHWRPEKRFDLVKATIQRVQQELSDTELVLLTKQPHDVVPKYMSACDALILTSDLEGSPMVVKEAMACNLPIVSVEVGDVRETIESTPGCYISDRNPEDIAQKLVDALREPVRTDGRTRIEHLRHDRIAERISKVYDATVNSQKQPTRCRKQRKDIRKRPAVCIVRHNYYPDSHVRRDAEALSRHAGYDVTIIALRKPGQPARESLDGVSIHRLPVEHRRGSILRYAWEYTAFAMLAFLRISKLHLRRPFSAVEVDNMPDILVFSALLPRLTGTPVILYVFDNMPELLAYLWQTSARNPMVRLLALQERISAAFANRVIVTQELPRQLAISRGVPDDKITVVVNCADETIFQRSSSRVQRSRDTSGFSIVTHGAILERYGIQVLVDAMPAITAAVPDAHLDIFGEGEYWQSLEQQVEKLCLSDHVTFRGFAPLEELLDSLAGANVGYVGMLNGLVLPNKLMEYVALQTPVVISRWPTFLHYFPEDSATYFQAGNANDLARAIINIQADPESAECRASQATCHYQQYRWDVQRNVYLGLYEQLVSKAKHMEAPSARYLAQTSSGRDTAGE